MAGMRGFWGSVETGGSEVMINLRLVRYARPTQGGSRLFFDGGDAIEVAAPFDVVSHRLYEAYDEDSGGGEGEGGGGGGEQDEGESGAADKAADGDKG